MIGKIRNIRDDKDFAFIVSGVNRDIFLHRSQFRGDWDELLQLHTNKVVEVTFDIEETTKGLRAIACKVSK